MPANRRRTRRLVKPSTDPCGVQEQPVGYTCNRKKGHRGDHACTDGEGVVIVKWNEREEWHGPVLHAADGPRAVRTLCGERAGTPAHPITYSPRLVRCKACLAVLTKSEAVAPIKRRR
jgi:hypothetical protein